MGLNLIIFDSSIHKTEVITHSITPPHPKSNDHDVVNTLAGNKSFTNRPPVGLTTPSTVPSASSTLGRLCSLLKCIMVKVKRAKDARRNNMFCIHSIVVVQLLRTF